MRDGGLLIASLVPGDEHLEADSRLIAAAPDLLAALRGLADLCENVPVFQLDGGRASAKAVRLAGDFTRAMEVARAAIAKAEGGAQ